MQLKSTGEVIHPGTGAAAVPEIPGGNFLAPDDDGRKQLAEWPASDSNSYFATAIVNRIWKSLMGRGLIEPADDLRKNENPATHPQLVERLAHELQRETVQDPATHSSDCDLGSLSARCWDGGQRTGRSILFPSLPQKLPPEVLADAYADVTGVPNSYGEMPPLTRTMATIDPATPAKALDVRPLRRVRKRVRMLPV